MLDRVQIYSILAQVLSRLADQGMPLSVDQHLRLTTLLDQLRSPLSLEQLSLLLTPILANTPEAQTNLHRWFSEAVLLVPIKEKNPIVAPPKLQNDSLLPVPETMDQVSENDASESEPPKPFDLDASVDAPSPSETYVAELQTFDKPPYVWTVELGAEREFATTADFRQLVNRMHDRQLLDAREIDIAATINTLVKQPGQVALYYRQLTQAPSYLLLIDQRAQNDHRAKIFDLLYTYLKFNEVQVSRFYFHADPKFCFNDDYPLGIPVAQLYPQNRSARLLILTYGYELFSSSTNAWSPWTKVLLQWKDRAILSPLPTRSWGAMEQKLAERFTILPATLMGLAAAIEEFQMEEAKFWEDYLGLIIHAPVEPIYYQGDLITTLEQYYPDPVIRKWIAACALYPTLHWELTLHIGTLLQRKYSHPNLTSVENLLELVRLPWFVDGRIPDQARDELVQWLEATSEEVRIRSLLLESLDRAPAPPDGSVAYADYRMQVVFNQWMLEQDPVKKAELENEFLKYLLAGKTLEFVTFKKLERAARRTEFEVPESWRMILLLNDKEETNFEQKNEKDIVSNTYTLTDLSNKENFMKAVARNNELWFFYAYGLIDVKNDFIEPSELIQEFYIRVFDKAEIILKRPPHHINGYLLVLLKHTYFGVRRRQVKLGGKWQLGDLFEEKAEENDVDLFIQNDSYRSFREKMMTILDDEVECSILELRIQGFTFKEIALKLKMSESGARAIRERTLKKLRKVGPDYFT